MLLSQTLHLLGSTARLPPLSGAERVFAGFDWPLFISSVAVPIKFKLHNASLQCTWCEAIACEAVESSFLVANGKVDVRRELHACMHGAGD